jgi:hypothetical protein
MSYKPHADFSALYFMFATDPAGLSAQTSSLNAQRAAADPLLVATGTDVVIFPGAGRKPLIESFRISTRGFVELTSISHLGLAIPYILKMRELGDVNWLTLVLTDLNDDDKRMALEQTYRQIWSGTRISVEVGREMFAGYPAFRPDLSRGAAAIDEHTRWVSEQPAVTSADDRRAFITRMRLVMEDPAQLVSNAPAHYIIDQLCAHGNDPGAVIIPGFTNVPYPQRTA